jgi:hypothetical protein
VAFTDGTMLDIFGMIWIGARLEYESSSPNLQTLTTSGPSENKGRVLYTNSVK